MASRRAVVRPSIMEERVVDQALVQEHTSSALCVLRVLCVACAVCCVLCAVWVLYANTGVVILAFFLSSYH